MARAGNAVGGDRDHVPRASSSTGSWASPGTRPCSPTSPTSTSSSTARSRRTAPRSSACSGRLAGGRATTRPRSSPGARGPRSRSSTATTPRRRGSRPPPTRPAPTSSPTARTRPPTSAPRRSRRTPAAFASPTPRRRGRDGSSFGWPAASTSTTRWRSSPSARRWASIPRRSATGSRRSRACPGRMERIDEGQPFAVIVDYAHSPASLQAVLDLLAPLAAAGGGGLIAVFGSAGERDTAKRAAMGRIAAERCRLVVATDEDPRGEDRNAIVDEIVRGAEAGGGRRGVDVLAIPDRREAIAAAFERARPGDVVLLAGKGHEASILYGDGPIPWDEAAVAREALAAMGYGGAERARMPVHAAHRRGGDRGVRRHRAAGHRGGRDHRRGHGGRPPVGRHGRHREQRPADRPARPPRRPGAGARHRRHVPRPRRSPAST